MVTRTRLRAVLSALCLYTRAERVELERKVSLLRPDNLDPDMLDERARAMLNYLHPRDLTLMLKK
jgi:cell division protein FtsB